ncbi:MAG: ATP-dependent DNA helicase, partial [Ruminococcaceae bacterium]|nr:ATP-dependent DNA helicase [Oscillospiraceae bacterium]
IAVGEGYADKIFYLTAKTVTGRAAIEAAERMQKYAPHLRSIMICAKEMVCPFRRKNSELPVPPNCHECEMTSTLSEDFGKTSISYRERELTALRVLLESDNHAYTIERITKTAAEFHVCPYELSLDLSEFCTVIVCDYNYALDDNVRIRRYFKNVQNTEKYVFLFDEAHNIPDRVRNTYSSVLKLSSADYLTELSEGLFSDNAEFAVKVHEYRSALVEIREMCTDKEYLRVTDAGDIKYGYYEDRLIPSELIRAAANLSRLLSKIIRDNDDLKDILEPYEKEISKAVFVSSFFDEKFRFFASRENDSLTAEILCIDPSGIIANMLSAANSVIMFSATLSPIEYFAEVTGLEDAEILELESPYERDNLCLVAFDSISTRLGDRRDTAYDCAEVIAETVSANDGNYIVYFPSYDYMKKVCRVFAGMMPECSIVMQKPGMSYRERDRFISIFKSSEKGSVVGFCVLGGMFSEGIDLTGESLIGTIIVGIGMPQISAERNIMAAYYDEKTERGHEFAYTCPGMNKVLQAAGRVIRSESDRGVVVLIDDRLGEPNMKLLFPPHWRHIKYTGDTESLRAILDSFWENE